MAMLASKDFTAAKKVATSGARPDDHWIKSLLIILLKLNNAIQSCLSVYTKLGPLHSNEPPGETFTT